MNDKDQSAAIRDLNDAFRRSLKGGTLLLTSGIIALGAEAQATIIEAVRAFDAFTPDNDPHGEHDFGGFDFAGQKFFWKIDYYDPQLKYGSDNPSDAAKTRRVMTIMLAEEY